MVKYKGIQYFCALFITILNDSPFTTLKLWTTWSKVILCIWRKICSSNYLSGVQMAFSVTMYVSCNNYWTPLQTPVSSLRNRMRLWSLLQSQPEPSSWFWPSWSSAVWSELASKLALQTFYLPTYPPHPRDFI